MTSFKLPELGENIEEAEVIRVLVKEGDTVKAEQNVLEVESEKAAAPLPCPVAGKVTRIHVKEGDTIHVGQELLTLEESNGKPPAKAKTSAAKGKDEPTAKETTKSSVAHEDGTASWPAQKREGESPAPAGPSTRRLARELGVALEAIHGSGPKGTILREDVEAAARDGRKATAPIDLPQLPDFKRWGPVKVEPLNRLARTAAERLSLAWRVIPHVTHHDFADLTDLEAARQRYEQRRAESEAKLTMTALVAKAVVSALKVFPHLNSSFDAAAGALILKEHYHIGIAVDTAEGLLVPVLRDVDKKSVKTLAAELAGLADKARHRKLQLDEMQGGTFTITNLGGIGGVGFTPIVNYPEVAILGLSRTRWGPDGTSDKGRMRLLLPLSLSYDHRAVNGAEAARFVGKLVELLSDPFSWLTEM